MQCWCHPSPWKWFDVWDGYVFTVLIPWSRQISWKTLLDQSKPQILRKKIDKGLPEVQTEIILLSRQNSNKAASLKLGYQENMSGMKVQLSKQWNNRIHFHWKWNWNALQNGWRLVIIFLVIQSHRRIPKVYHQLPINKEQLTMRSSISKSLVLALDVNSR